MSRSDAERALEIYRDFAKQTDFVVGYLATARQYEQQTRVEIPKLKHAPVTLGKQLEDYLADADFDTNRRQYLAEQAARKDGRPKEKPAVDPSKAPTSIKGGVPANNAFPSNASGLIASISQSTKLADTDLIDFFDSISSSENYQSQTAMQQETLPGTVPLNYNSQQGAAYIKEFQPPAFYQQPQQQVQQQQATSLNTTNDISSGHQFHGGYPMQKSFMLDSSSQINPRQIPHTQHNWDATTTYDYPNNTTHVPVNNGQQQSNSQQATNPFRQSVIGPPQTGHVVQQFTASSFNPSAPQATNPFIRGLVIEGSPQNVEPANQQLSQVPAGQAFATHIQPQPTGTNPFARNRSPPNPNFTQMEQPGIVPQATGNTNPFRQSAFVNSATGAGWQLDQQRMGGGLDNLETIPIFPRPGQQQPWQ